MKRANFPIAAMSQLSRIVCLLVYVATLRWGVQGHGRLIEPPSRASAWRYGFKTPPNYNDHELYCGGYSRQYNRNSGKCGVCGDPWDITTPRPHEYGGIYGQGVIVRTYIPSTVITIRVELTANHFGYFEFKLCENYRNTSQECLDKHQLKLTSNNRKLIANDPNGARFYPRDGNRVYEMRYKLPNISCEHCVLQWTYTAGNNWGACRNGTEAVGCGPQETFRACADIRIQPGREISTTEETITTETSELDKYKYDGFKTLAIVGISLFIVLLLFSIVYTYYYELGRRIKGCLRRNPPHNTSIVIPPAPKESAPVPPPRIRRQSSNAQINESLA